MALSKEAVVDAFNTLLFAWGGDTPSEATWAANEMMAALTGVATEDLVHQLKELDNTEEDYKSFFNQL